MVNEKMRRIVILGAAESGVGAAALAKVKGFDVFVSDMGKIKESYKQVLREYDVPWEEEHHTEELILNAVEVVKSPGIPEDAPMVQKVRNAGIPVISEIEFAGRYTDAKMICITGSNGKTTTTSLIYHIFKKAGYNVGLDRYEGSMQKYTDAKMRIVQNQTEDDAFIYWNDDPIISAELKKYGIKARMCPFSIIKKEGMIGYIADGKYTIEYPTPFNMEQESLSLRGKHNMYNSLAAGIAARISGIDDDSLRQSLSDFEGVEHRLQKVARVGGVQYINDSKATNVDACWYALESMTTPTILIIGGKDKGNDYNAIKELVQKKCAGLVYLGADNTKLHNFFDGMGIPVADTNNMKDCVAACARMAKPGYTVLLSPCCASFDLFKNMEDRGEQFCEQVRNL